MTITREFLEERLKSLDKQEEDLVAQLNITLGAAGEIRRLLEAFNTPVPECPSPITSE